LLRTSGIVAFFEVVIVDVLLNPLGVDPTEFVGLVVFVEMLADPDSSAKDRSQYGQSGIDYAFEESGEKERDN